MWRLASLPGQALRDLITGLAEAELPGHTKQLLALLPGRHWGRSRDEDGFTSRRNANLLYRVDTAQTPQRWLPIGFPKGQKRPREMTPEDVSAGSGGRI